MLSDGACDKRLATVRPETMTGIVLHSLVEFVEKRWISFKNRLIIIFFLSIEMHAMLAQTYFELYRVKGNRHIHRKRSYYPRIGEIFS